MSTIHKDWCASIRRSQDLPGSDPYPCDCEVDSKSKQVPDGTVSSPAHQEWLRRRSQQEPLNPVPNKEDLSRGTFACPICGIGTPHSFADALSLHNERFKKERWLAYVAGTQGPNGGKI